LNVFRKFSLGSVLLAAFFAASAATPLENNKLLHLILTAAEWIVSGIAVPSAQVETGRLLVVTEAINLDANESLTLLGVDGGRIIREVIQVLVVQARRFERSPFAFRGPIQQPDHLQGGDRGGADRFEYRGVGVLALPPPLRERSQFSESRWLAIMNDKILIFGMPSMVAKALDLYEDNIPTDPMLVQHLAQLHPNVNSWCVSLFSPGVLNAHLAPHTLSAAWRIAPANVADFSLGVHYGRAARIDFAIHMRNDGPSGGFTEARSILAGLRWVKDSHMKSETAAQDSLRGSITLHAKKLDDWLASVVLNTRVDESNTQR
jgi:hypothetical protein